MGNARQDFSKRLAEAMQAKGYAPRPGVLPGRVLRVFRGTHGDEVTLTLTGGQQLVGFAERPNRLRAGSAALAQVDDRVVVLALPG